MEVAFEIFGDSESSDDTPIPPTVPLVSLIDRVTIPLQLNETHASLDRRFLTFSSSTHDACVRVLRNHGVLILPGLFHPDFILSWRAKVFNDLDEALRLVPDGEDHSLIRYHEIASRQASRFEVRNGKNMISVQTKDERSILTDHEGVLSIIRQVFACSGEPAVSLRDIRATRDIGSFVSVPGAQDQNLHADLDHLFFGGPHLPPHYITMFIPALDEESGALDPNMGQTEFFVGTHRLSSAKKTLNGEISESIKPRLTAGDAILYDARLLHRGLANNSLTMRRPILYVNFQRSWFVDQQNWSEKSLFSMQTNEN